MFLAGLRHLSLPALGSSLLQAFGALWLAVELTAFFSAAKFSASIKPLWWLFALVGVFIGLYRAWPRLSASALVPGTDCTIAIAVTDMFDVPDAAYIVGTNTTFDTAMEDGTISEFSVQGQLTKRFCNSLDQLDRDIAHSLEGATGQTLTAADKPYGKMVRYEAGTVASIVAGKMRVYLVAIANMNAHRVAQASRRDVADALPRLWEHIRTRGGLEQLCCPILGSGFSRLDATRDELVREIIRSFIPAVRAGAFCRGLTIAVNPGDYRLGRLDLAQLGAFLQYECTYGSAALTTGTPAIGTPQG